MSAARWKGFLSAEFRNLLLTGDASAPAIATRPPLTGACFENGRPELVPDSSPPEEPGSREDRAPLWHDIVAESLTRSFHFKVVTNNHHQFLPCRSTYSLRQPSHSFLSFASKEFFRRLERLTSLSSEPFLAFPVSIESSAEAWSAVPSAASPTTEGPTPIEALFAIGPARGEAAGGATPVPITAAD